MAGAALGASSATFAWQVQHLVHLALLLRGRRGTLTVWDVLVRAWSPRGTGCFCVAGAALSASSATFAWQVQALGASSTTFAWQARHFDCLGRAGARLVAAGDRLLLRGRRSALCIYHYFCVADAALSLFGTCWCALGRRGGPAAFAWQAQHFSASSATFAWQAQHLHLPLLLRGRRSTFTVWDVLVRAWSPRGTGCFCVAGAALSASSVTFAWQAQHLVHLALLLRGRCSTWCI